MHIYKIYTYTHIRIYTSTHIYIYTCTRIHVYMYTRIHVYTYTRIHVYTCTRIYVCTYTRIHISANNDCGFLAFFIIMPILCSNDATISYPLHQHTCERLCQFFYYSTAIRGAVLLDDILVLILNIKFNFT